MAPPSTERNHTMTSTNAKPTRRQKRALTKARSILHRVEHLDTCGCWDFENTRNRELAALRSYIDLLEGPYLTLPGLRQVEEMIDWSEQWIDDIEAEDAEAQP
jgi:hypothetical protein